MGEIEARVYNLAKVLAAYAEPLVKLLHESKRTHYHCEDGWYCCGKCPCSCPCPYQDADEHMHSIDCYPDTHSGEAARQRGVCNCGADTWNNRVDAVLDGR